jgi:hypothetical protein
MTLNSLSIEIEKIFVKSIEEIPSMVYLRGIPRGKTVRLVLEDSLRFQQAKIGESLIRELPGFQVGINQVHPEINICKLITYEEIEMHQDFFENCAKDYRKLSTELINKLASTLNLEINSRLPLLTFRPLLHSNTNGKMEQWRYSVHGYHCRFEHRESLQTIEVPLVFGLEFGDLDPWFFTQYIKSTKGYHPLPVPIYEDYADGVRIIEKMLSLGKFERIPSNIENRFGVVVSDRENVSVEVYNEKPQMVERKSFNLWKFLGLR